MEDHLYAFNAAGFKGGKPGLRDQSKKNTNRLEDLIRQKDRLAKSLATSVAVDVSPKWTEPVTAGISMMAKPLDADKLADPVETIRLLRLELQAKEDRISALTEESKKQRETIEAAGNEGYSGAGTGGFGGENAKKSPISILEKIELNKRKQAAATANSQEQGLSKADATELQKLRAVLKKYEEQKELLSIEKDQLEQEMKEKNTEIDSLKQKLKAGSKGSIEAQDQYLNSLRQFKDLTCKINTVSTSLPSVDDLKDWKVKIEELSKENERLRKELRNGNQAQGQNPTTGRSASKPAKKSVSKDTSKDKPQVTNGYQNGTGNDYTKNLLHLSLEQVEKFNTNYIKDLTSEYYLLEQEFEDFKYKSSVQVARLQNDLKEKDEEIRSLRKEVINLKNQREMLIIDFNKPSFLRPGSPQRMGTTSMGTTTFYLGKSPAPRDEFPDESNLTYSRKTNLGDEPRLTEIKPRKRMGEADGKVKELMSADAKHSYVVDSG